MLLRLLALLITLLGSSLANAQTDPLVFATVTREPFSIEEDGQRVGFSIELMQQLAAALGRTVEFEAADSFGDMLDRVRAGSVDGAIANISITAEREGEMDFSQPIFASGIQIMAQAQAGSPSVINALLTPEIGLFVLIALTLLLGSGMAMWVFERKNSGYFDRPDGDVTFPAFWWALNVVVNGGFEERMPKSRPGRVFGTLLVLSSLFLVSVFVAKITAAMTISALQSSVSSISDLEGKQVGTIRSSTSSDFLEDRDIRHARFDDLEALFRAFEKQTLDVVVFDKPILAYYAQTRGHGKAQLIERVFMPEDYGIAIPTDSPLREQINRSLLELREDGSYETLRSKWFGQGG